MGLFDNLLRRGGTTVEPPLTKADYGNVTAGVMAAGAMGEATIQTFNNSNITYQGDLSGFDYTSILRNKQENMNQLYSLSDYFIDADPIYRGTIRHVYVPFSMYPKWRLVGVDDRTRAKFFEYYKNIKLQKKMISIFLQFYKYGNVFVYVMPDGNIITLPVTKCKITNVALDGEPLVQYDLSDLRNSFTGFGSNDQRYFKDEDLKKQLKGYPEEVGRALVKGKDTAQLNPDNLFVLQDTKEDWQRYAIPMIASFLPHFAKKALISQHEDALLNVGARTFVHVTYGGPDARGDMLPNREQLIQVRNIFSRAMAGNPLAVTNNWAKAEVIQPETGFLHENDNYKEVNNALLSAGGISGIVVTGISEDGSTFASAQISMQTAVARIEQALSSFADMMTAINERVYQMVMKKKSGNIPEFKFMPLDLSGRKAMQEAGMSLWKEGTLSYQTLLENYGYDMGEEVSKRTQERKDGVHDILDNWPKNTNETSQGMDTSDDGESARGRPAMDDTERNSPPEDAETGRMPKPSNPEGSMGE